ncbi:MULTISPECIES: SgcJ/EcaC family oxidoreductase [unclassified Bacillus (in: firmicutes)]|uniref:SgcJ/EcaC family oxidoreductase n=1 Tax=unclassified Bacillus (in: firmicutes) TaxID=185979 RepID=UPI0008F0A8BD|nr:MULTISPECIES: SgcJ/EcaC family oxidoreductase [unclassified Bacillus (in: firmicutes)]SFB07100.1 conserved hypothetical protein [Bacillus sp. UNCCL13]SFQ87466.1 conserved hypothetical protein [Bacillus sp. cl95]
METSASNDIHTLYQNLMDTWNRRNARDMADLFGESGELIGFDGSTAKGSNEIFSHLALIFENHPTAPYVSKIKDVRFLSSTVAVLRAIGGMIPIGQSDLESKLNAHHTLVAVQHNEKWSTDLFQNTPAAFHGRPELVEEMTNELRQELN